MALPLSPVSQAKLEIAPATAFPLSITEVTGLRRQITLRGRSLPHRGTSGGSGGVAFPSELRVNVHYFPGNPVGQAQVLGAQWGNTTLTGRWSDAWLDQQGNGPLLINFPPIGAAGQPGSGVLGGKSFASSNQVTGSLTHAQRARVIRDAFYILQRSGQLLKVEWGSIVRFGFLTEFTPTHEREEDIQWEAEFTWIGETDAQQIPKEKENPAKAKLLATMLAAMQEFVDMVNRFLSQAFGKIATITQKIVKFGNLVTQVLQSLTAAVSLVFVPLDIISTLRQQFASVILAAKDLLDTLRDIPAAYKALKNGQDPVQACLAEEFTAAIAYNAAILGVELAEADRQLKDLESPDLQAVYTATGEETLRDISTRAYGTPAGWVTIAEYNNFKSSIVSSGTIVRIPKRVGVQSGAAPQTQPSRAQGQSLQLAAGTKF